jgi:3-oxoacyl-ACP reductase-like protein
MGASKLPGGFSLAAAKQYLETKYGLGAERQNGAMLHALTMEPASRLDSKQKAEAWLDSVATSYAQASGVTLGRYGPACDNCGIQVEG